MSESVSKGLGLAVRQARGVAGLSQEALADAAGLDRAYVSGLERGTRNPTLQTMQKIAQALDVPLHELIQRAEDSA